MRRGRFAIAIVGVLAACDLPHTPPEPTIEVVTSLDDAPTWAVRYGDEHWRRTPGALDLGDAIDRVTHALTGDAPRVTTPTFTAAFDGRGLAFTAADASALRVRTTRVAIGDDELYAGDGAAWSVLGNTAQGRLADQLVEHHEVRREGVELTWVLRAPTPRELVVDVALDGLAHAGATEHGLHLADASGTSRVRIGNAVLVDADGDRWPIATEPTREGVRYRVDGAVLASADFPVALDPVISAELGMDQPIPTVSSNVRPAIASNGTEYLLVWNNDGPGIWATRLSSAGIVLDPVGFAISTEETAIFPAVASNGASYLVTWAEHGVRGRRVSANGTLIDSSPLVIAPAGEYSRIASNGADYMVALWSWGSDAGVRVRRIDPAGVVHPGFTVTGVTAGMEIMSNGTDFLLVWGVREEFDPGQYYCGDLRALRLSATAVLQNLGVINTGVSGNCDVAIASDGTDYLVAWGYGQSNIVGRRVTAAGLQAPIAVTNSASGGPAIAFDGANYLVAWPDGRNLATTGRDVYGTLMSPAGVVATPGGTMLSSLSGNESELTAASNGAGFVLSWQQTHFPSTFSNVLFARVSSAGTAMSPATTIQPTQANLQESPSVAFNGTNYLVAWIDHRSGNRDVYGIRVSPTNGVLDPVGFAITMTSTDEWAPAASSDGSDFFVAWNEDTNQIVGARVAANGVVLDATGLLLSTAGTGWPGVASNGTDYLVSWNNGGKRVSATGVVLDASELAIPRGDVASNGTDYLLVFDQGSVGARNVYGLRIAAGGSVGTAFPISTAVETASLPVVASDGTNYLVAWTSARDVLGDYRYVYAARVAGTGTTTGPEVRIASEQHPVVELASDGSDYLLAWARLPSPDPRGVRIVDGGVLGCEPHFTLSQGRAHGALKIAGGSAGYLAVYEANARIAGRFVTGPLGAIGTCDAEFTCPEGFVPDGTACIDVDECLGAHGCSDVCSNLIGSFVCGCPAGLELDVDVQSCVDIDECLRGTSDCAQACANTDGGYTCSCDAGYVLASNAQGCDDIDECTLGTHACEPSAMCSNSIGEYACKCGAGFLPSGNGCVDLDECAIPNICDPNATCTNTAGRYTCECVEGFTGNGFVCDARVDDDDDDDGGCQTSSGGGWLLALGIALGARRRRRVT